MAISVLTVLLAAAATAQTPCALTIAAPEKLTVPRGTAVDHKLRVSLAPGCHTNSHQPSEPYLIPLRLTWEPGPIEAASVRFPEPKLEKYSYAETPLSVFGGEFDITTTFQRKPAAAPGPGSLTGKLRYQACNERMCFPPRTVEVKLPLLLR